MEAAQHRKRSLHLRTPHRFGILLLTVGDEGDQKVEMAYQNYLGSLKQIASSDSSKQKNRGKYSDFSDIEIELNCIFKSWFVPAVGEAVD